MNRSTSLFFLSFNLALVFIFSFYGPIGIFFNVILVSTIGLFLSKKPKTILTLVFLLMYFTSFLEVIVTVDRGVMSGSDAIVSWVEFEIGEVLEKGYFKSLRRSMITLVQIGLTMGYFVGVPIMMRLLSYVIDRIFRIRRRVGVFYGIR